MRLSTKGRYAVTAMLDLSIRYEDGPVTLADIAETQSISLSRYVPLTCSSRIKLRNLPGATLLRKLWVE